MNATLSFADWHKLKDLDDGMYGVFNGDPNEPENPLETATRARIIQLNAGQPLFRWIDSKKQGSWEQKASGSWWSSKRGAQQILERMRRAGASDTREHARWYSSVARKWPSDLAEVVHVMVTQPIKAFMGVGREIWDAENRELWDSHGLQIYIPNMAEKQNNVWTLSRIAKQHLRIVWVKSSSAFEAEM